MDEKIKGLRYVIKVFTVLLILGPIMVLFGGYLGQPAKFKLIFAGQFPVRWSNIFEVPLLFFVIAIFEVLICSLFLWAFKKRANDLEWLQFNGRKIVAVITSIKKVTYDRSAYFELEAEWQKPEDGKMYKFFDQLKNEPAGVTLGKSKIDVIINYENLKQFCIDLKSIKN